MVIKIIELGSQRHKIFSVVYKIKLACINVFNHFFKKKLVFLQMKNQDQITVKGTNASN